MSDSKQLTKILECIFWIEKFSRDGEKNFFFDRKTQDAILRNFQVIGDAIKELPEEIRAKYPNIPWRDVARFRDRVTHDYLGIDLDKVWDAITNHLPEFKKQVEQIKLEPASSTENKRQSKLKKQLEQNIKEDQT